jgi:hypothetical protein
MNGYMKRPAIHRSIEGGDLLLGPVQFNWYNRGFRIHFTWPFANPRTLTIRQSA